MNQEFEGIPVFYSERMLADAGSFSPSASKPQHVLAAWQKADLAISVRSITPASEAYDSAGGYCTFNGLVVTAAKLLAEDALQRVLILDCDMHYGDGTDEILGRLGLTRSISNTTFGRWFHEPSQGDAYLERLRETVVGFDAFDLILYQAGADAHVDDPLGGVLTTEQMVERDRIVFDAARAIETPIAWNLAGGYQTPLSKVIDLHVNTLRACVESYKAVEK